MRRHHHRPIRANERLYREYFVTGQPQTHLAPVLVRHVLVSPFPNRQDRWVGERALDAVQYSALHVVVTTVFSLLTARQMIPDVA